MWPVSFIQILNGGERPIPVKVFTHIPCGNTLLNFYPNKLENSSEMVGYLGKYNYKYIFNNILKLQLAPSKT